MISTVLKLAQPRSLQARLAAVPLWVWWLLAVAFVLLNGASTAGTGFYGTLRDPDDATRLIQVRELIASGHWFDTTTMKVGGDAGMLSHWSRLVDLPLALIIASASLVMSPEHAEGIALVIWPTALLAAAFWIVAHTTSRVAGSLPAALALAFIALSPFAYYQFVVGRIDHHNAMITSITSATLLIWAYPYDKKTWTIAGLLTGLALAIGYEALAPAVALGAFVTLWGLADKRAATPAAYFAVALSLTFALAFFATIPPSRWLDVRCDAISLNMVALVACGTAGVAVVLHAGRNWPLPVRLAVIAATAAAGIAAFGYLEPKCLAGPKGQLPPMLSKVWLDDVAENASIFAQFVHRDFELSFGLMLFFAIAVVTQCRETMRSRSQTDLFFLSALLAITGFACWQYKYMGYASLLAVVPIAIGVSRLPSLAGLGPGTIRLAAVVLSSQALLLAGSKGFDQIFGAHTSLTKEMLADASACSKTDALQDLAALPPGLVASHIDIGAFIAALTPQRALAAPYHRIADAIIANHQIFWAHNPADAATALKREHVDYVVTCKGIDTVAYGGNTAKGTLGADLVANRAPSFLVPVTLPNPSSLYRVWKVDQTALNLPPLAAGPSAR